MRDLDRPPVFSIASLSDIEQTARQLAQIRESFLATGATGGALPRPVIRDSWERCRALEVNATRSLALFSAPADSQIAELRAASAPLLAAARPVLARLRGQLGDVGYVVALSDAEGRLLEIDGNRERMRRLARKGLLPGSDWSEAAAGTNAIGTALATGRVVQLLAAEHYCEGWQDVTCTAAPILHPGTGQIAGVLDITGDYRLVRPFLTGVLAVAAFEVQQNLWRPDPAAPARRFFRGVTLPASGALGPPADARRIQAAERLAAALGAISASLDLAVTLDAVAAQFGQALGLACAAACLFDADDAPSRVWQRRGRGRAAAQALATLAQQPETAAWCEEGAPLVYATPAQIPPALAALALPAGIRALALIPLTAARGLIGVLLGAHLAPHPWDVDDLRLGLAIAAHAATALENARMFTDLRRHARHRAALNAMATFLSTLLDPSQHLDLVIRQIAGIADFDAGVMLLRDAPDGDLGLVASHGLPGGAGQPGGADRPPPALLDLVRPALESGASRLICRLHGGEPLSPPIDALQLCDLVVMPLTLHNVSIGALVVGSRRHRPVTPGDLTLFTTIGQQLGLALSNARLRRAASETEALRAADQLKSAFLAAVSHDLRTPLTAIRASVEGLLERPELTATPETHDLLQNIAQQAGRLGRYVDQLLDLSSIEAGRLALDREWIELSALIEDALGPLRQRDAACVVEASVSPDLPLYYGDPTLLGQMLWNLLENAQKYGPPGGPVRVEAFSTGDSVLINVADRGPGIAEAERERIFQHFYRLERDRRTHVPGSGLGLAICRGIVEAHGGRIWVDARPGGGSVFRVRLPLAPPELAALPRPDGAPCRAEPPRPEESHERRPAHSAGGR
jgi:two-component system sensor histidine kinase KdpD